MAVSDWSPAVSATTLGRVVSPWSAPASATTLAVPRSGSASGSWTAGGTVSGQSPRGGSASGSWQASGAASGTAPGVTPKVSRLVDSFTGLNTSRWTFDPNVSNVAGQLVLGTDATYQGATSNVVYDVTESSVFVEVPQVAVGYTADTFLLLVEDDGNTVRNGLYLGVEDGVLYCQVKTGGVTTTIGSPTYDPTAHRWWRMGESGGVVTWSASPDGRTWTDLATWTVTGLAVDQLLVKLETGMWGGTGIADTPATFDNVNAAPRSGSAAGGWSSSGSVSGVAPRSGSASGSWSVSGSASGDAVLIPVDVCLTYGTRTRQLTTTIRTRRTDTTVRARTLTTTLEEC